MSLDLRSAINQRLGGVGRAEPGPGGLTRLSIETPACRAAVFLHGAHVAAWQPAGAEEVLFMSRQSRFEPGSPIRGGVPICFPWFADRAGAPAHGFARQREWRLSDARHGGDGVVAVSLELHDDEATRALWPHRFAAAFTARFGATLEMTLEVANRGDAPFTFEAALHTYFGVSDIHDVAVRGLEGSAYVDRLAGPAEQGAEPIRFAAETDRIHQPSGADCLLDDPGRRRRVRVSKAGSGATVVWNPWIAKAQRLSDFADDEWRRMLCIETANIGASAVSVAPGRSHAMTQTVRLEALP